MSQTETQVISESERAAEQALLRRLRIEHLVMPIALLDDHCWKIFVAVVRELAARPTRLPRRDRT